MAKKSDAKFVKWLQERLYQLGYDDVRGSGTNDAFTQDAIRDIQRQFNLKETGTATKEFIDQLRGMKPQLPGQTAAAAPDVLNEQPGPQSMGMPRMRPPPRAMPTPPAPRMQPVPSAARTQPTPPAPRMPPPGREMAPGGEMPADWAATTRAQVAAGREKTRAQGPPDFAPVPPVTQPPPLSYEDRRNEVRARPLPPAPPTAPAAPPQFSPSMFEELQPQMEGTIGQPLMDFFIGVANSGREEDWLELREKLRQAAKQRLDQSVDMTPAGRPGAPGPRNDMMQRLLLGQ